MGEAEENAERPTPNAQLGKGGREGKRGETKGGGQRAKGGGGHGGGAPWLQEDGEATNNSERANQGNGLASVAPVSKEIPVGRKNEAVAFDFGHSDEASIGKRHRDVTITLQMAQDFNRMLMVGEIRSHADQVLPEQAQ